MTATLAGMESLMKHDYGKKPVRELYNAGAGGRKVGKPGMARPKAKVGMPSKKFKNLLKQ